jgi:hypothetical protein
VDALENVADLASSPPKDNKSILSPPKLGSPDEILDSQETVAVPSREPTLRKQVGNLTLADRQESVTHLSPSEALLFPIKVCTKSIL